MARDYHPGVWQKKKHILSLFCHHHSATAEAATTTTTTTTTGGETFFFLNRIGGYSLEGHVNRPFTFFSSHSRAYAQTLPKIFPTPFRPES
jgi:hypothetical protein